MSDPGDEHQEPDIVGRLRIRWDAMGDMANDERQMAADEIMALRADVEMSDCHADHYLKQTFELRCTIDKMRQQLNEIKARNVLYLSRLQEYEARSLEDDMYKGQG